MISQELHVPADIYKIMEKSDISYQLDLLKSEVQIPDRTEKLNYNNQYRKIENGTLLTYNYSLTEEINQILSNGEKLFHEKNFVEARNEYLKVLEKDSTLYNVMTYIGQTYGIEKNYEKAIEWYTKTIKANYIDYMAHWFLADIYITIGENDLALNEIVIANILNRNNPRLKKSLKGILINNKMDTLDWTFNPQMTIDSIAKNNIKVSAKEEWLGYALAKSVWLFEPGYREKMGASKSEISITEEKECLLCLISIIDDEIIKKHPEFTTLQNSVNEGMIDEYIFYEIILPDYPFVAYQLPESFIDNIKDYVIKVRGSKM